MIYILTFIGFWMVWNKLAKLEERIQRLEVIGMFDNTEPNEKLRQAAEKYREYKQGV